MIEFIILLSSPDFNQFPLAVQAKTSARLARSFP
jgi:hypothetical protein